MEGKEIDPVSALADRIAGSVAERLEGKLKEKSLMLSPKSIAHTLDCSISEVRKQLQEHRIPTVRFGNRGYRVPRDEFEKRIARWRAGGDLWD